MKLILLGAPGAGKGTQAAKIAECYDIPAISTGQIIREAIAAKTEFGNKMKSFIDKGELVPDDVVVGMVKERLKNDEFLEHNEYVNNYYGTPKQPVFDAIENGEDIILEIDVNGADVVRSKMKEAISIFIMPPSYCELKNRLTSRGTDSQEVIDQRLSAALSEIERAAEYDYIVTNDIVDRAVDDILHIILANRLTIDRQKEFINEVLKKC